MSNNEWYAEEATVYTLRDSVWLGQPTKENDVWFGVNKHKASQDERNVIAAEIAYRLNNYDNLEWELENAKKQLSDYRWAQSVREGGVK